MPAISTLFPLNMDTFPLPNIFLRQTGESEITFRIGGITATLTGEFELDSDGQVTGGTVEEIEHSLYGYYIILAVEGLEMDVTTVMDALYDLDGPAYLELLTSGDDSLSGSNSNDNLRGGTGDDEIDGAFGDDQLMGEAGADILWGGYGNDTLDGGIGQDILFGEDGDDILYGGGQTDLLLGGDGNDLLFGGDGADGYDGGAGEDTVSYIDADESVTASLLLQDTNAGAAEDEVYIDVENLTGTLFADTLSGDDNANVLNGNDGDDILSGNGGDDTLIGGAGADDLDGDGGEDAASYETATGGVVADLETGSNNTGDAEGDTYGAIEILIGSDFDDDLRADSDDNTLYGGAGDDVLRGRDGADALIGGAGSDTANYSGSGGVRASLEDTSLNTGEAEGDEYSGIENLSGSGSDDDLRGDDGDNTLYGDAGDDSLRGADGDDILIGGAGADVHNGGDGIDTVDYSDSNQNVSVDILANQGRWNDAQGDTYSSIENAITGSGDDYIEGTHDANTLISGDGDDTVWGRQGDDILYGEDGDDELVGNANDDILYGGAGDDRLDGRVDDDILYGGAGADYLDGGKSGNDTAAYDNATSGVAVSLLDGAGTRGEADGDTLVNIDNLHGSQHHDSLTGNNSGNELLGRRGRDTLNGEGGNDTLEGGRGSDRIQGGDGNDRIEGGVGQDRLNGGDGSDTFVFEYSRSGVDNLFGFEAEFDTIEISGGRSGVLVFDLGNDTLVEHGTARILLRGVSLIESDIDFDFV